MVRDDPGIIPGFGGSVNGILRVVLDFGAEKTHFPRFYADQIRFPHDSVEDRA